MVVLIAAAMILSLTGCYDIKEISYTVAAIAIGIDKGEKSNYSVSFQIEKSGTNSSDGEGEDEKKKSELITVEAPTVSAAYERANDMSSVHLSIDNLKMVLLSEEICREGIERVTAELMCDMNLKNNAAMAVTLTRADEMLGKIAPEDEEYISAFYQRVLYNKYNITTDYFLIEEVYFNLLSKTGQDIMLPVVTYRGFDETAETGESSVNLGSMRKEKGFETEFFGGALIKDGVMEGVLTEHDMLAASLIYGDLKAQKISVEYPRGTGNYVVLELKQQKKPKFSLNIKNGKVDEDITVFLAATYQFAGKEEKFSDFNPEFTENLREELEKICTDFIEETVKGCGADVISTGKRLKRCFMTNDEFDAFNYEEKLKDSSFDVTVLLDMRSGGRFIFK